MRSERNSPIKSSVENLHLSCRSLNIRHCDNPASVMDFLPEEDAKKSFPPDGKLLVSELDTFYIIMLGNEPVGFYRIEDLFFDGEIELHGSFIKHDSLLNRTYFELTVMFVNSVMELFPKKSICTTIVKDNHAVRKFLDYLGFKPMDNTLLEEPYMRYVKIK